MPSISISMADKIMSFKEFIASCFLLKGDRKRVVTVSKSLVLKENPENGLLFAIPRMPQGVRVSGVSTNTPGPPPAEELKVRPVLLLFKGNKFIVLSSEVIELRNHGSLECDTYLLESQQFKL